MLQAVFLLTVQVVSMHAYNYYNCSSCHSFNSCRISGISLSDVKNILIDEENQKIIIAARDLLIRTDPSLLYNKSSYEYLKLAPSKERIQQCISSGNEEKDCHNYMRVLIFDNNDNIFTCGTYGTTPRCWRIQRNGPLVQVSVITKAKTRSPSFPDQNVTTVITDHPARNGFLFTGLNIGPGTRSSYIYREAINISLDKSFLKTVDSDLFLQDANFVSSYTANDNFVYFYWREKAVESLNMEVYSRVGRICTYDSGGPVSKMFTSFTKTRLLCSATEEFAYNYLQSTFKLNSSSSEIIYGVFTTPESGLVGSAVCSYSLKDIQKLFATSQYLEEVPMDNPGIMKTRAWKTVSAPSSGEIPGRPKCDSSLKTVMYQQETVQFANNHPLLADSLTKKPLIVMPNIRFTQIVVDMVTALVSGKLQTIPVMFLATENGTIYKVAEGIAPNKHAKIIEQIDVFNSPRQIRSLKLYQNSLYVGCTSAISRVPTQRCSQQKTCRSCIELQDPYCGWTGKQCTTKDKAGNSWIQDVVYGQFTSVCPEEPPTCSIQMTVNNPGGTTVLECSISGIPVPIVTHWLFNNDKIIQGPDYNIQDYDYSQTLSVYKFGLKNLGDYSCTVQNNKGESKTCSLSIKGTLPVVSSGFIKKDGQTYFWCTAKGIPTPRISRYKVIGGQVLPVTGPINGDVGRRSYYCLAQNKFGPAMGENVTLEERKLDVNMKLTQEEWYEELKNQTTAKYKMLADKLKIALQTVFYNSTEFMDTIQVSFSKGSVVAKIVLRFACKTSVTDEQLLVNLQATIWKGKVGSLQVEKSNILSKYTTVPTQGYRRQEKGIDEGLFAVAILITIVLSVIVGFLLGIKFHQQALSSCGPKKYHDSSVHEEKSVQSLKYTKSPTKTNSRKSDEKQTELLKDNELENKNDGDGDSIGSSGGRIHIIIDPKTPEKSVLVNGKAPKTC